MALSSPRIPALITLFSVLHLLHLLAHLVRLILSVSIKAIDWCAQRMSWVPPWCHTLSPDLHPISAVGSRRKLECARVQFRKVPRHLALVWVPLNHFLHRLITPSLWLVRGSRLIRVVEGKEVEAMIKDVCKLVDWAHQLGIEELSLYDERGFLKKSRHQVIQSILQQSPSFCLDPSVPSLTSLSSSSSKERVRFRLLLPDAPSLSSQAEEDTPIKPAGSGKTSSKTKRVLTVNIIDRFQAHYHLAQVSLNLLDGSSAQKKLGNHALSALGDLDVKSIGESICASSIGPPDLLCVLGGRSLRLRGFPPWQINLTEIYHARSYSILPFTITCREFLEGCRLFSECEQRVGK